MELIVRVWFVILPGRRFWRGVDVVVVVQPGEGVVDVVGGVRRPRRVRRVVSGVLGRAILAVWFGGGLW